MPDSLYIYRMTHIKNLDFIFKKGLWAMNCAVQDPCFIPIGNSDIISMRQGYPVRINPPGGVLGDYIPFYFAGHSPMLYNIVTGYNVLKLPQDKIVFIACDVNRFVSGSFEWCFTDGHAKKAITKFYNSLDDLSQLDWNAINSTWWRADENDMDRPRKKMSEFLVREHIPADYIEQIYVRSANSLATVSQMVYDNNLNIPVHIDTKFELFYNL